jgi:hypothetical protein
MDRKEEIEKRFPKMATYVPPSLYCRWLIPHLDASFNLQTEKDDLNCALYTYSYISAMLTLVDGEQSSMQEIIGLARDIFKDDTNNAAKEALTSIFTDRVKQYLPQYYDVNGNRKPLSEVKHYHMQLRWKLSSDWLKRAFNQWGKVVY